ncbi:Cupin domain [Legionella spiritensis]|nr:Cupin domain [Legionella spiritensis]
MCPKTPHHLVVDSRLVLCTMRSYRELAVASHMFPEMIKNMEKVNLEQFSFYQPSSKAFITFTEIPKGAIIPPHTHQNPVCNYLVSGKLEVEFEQTKKIINAGEWFEIIIGQSHALKCLEEASMIEVWPDGIDE